MMYIAWGWLILLFQKLWDGHGWDEHMDGQIDYLRGRVGGDLNYKNTVLYRIQYTDTDDDHKPT